MVIRGRNKPGWYFGEYYSPHLSGIPVIPGTSVRLTEPLEDTFAGYLSFPGFEIEDEPVRMIGADIGRTAPETLVPDRIFFAVIAFLFRHGNQILFLLLRHFFGLPEEIFWDETIKTGSVQDRECGPEIIS
jgi:hypothetical protein